MGKLWKTLTALAVLGFVAAFAPAIVPSLDLGTQVAIAADQNWECAYCHKKIRCSKAGLPTYSNCSKAPNNGYHKWEERR